MWSIIFFILLILYLGLASVGHRFFIHQLYVSRLLKLFDYGKRKIRKIQQNIQQERKIQRKISRAMSVNANLDQLADLAAKAATMPDSDESDADSAFCEDFDSSDGQFFSCFYFYIYLTLVLNSQFLLHLLIIKHYQWRWIKPNINLI